MPNQTNISLDHHRKLVAEEVELDGLAVSGLRIRQEEDTEDTDQVEVTKRVFVEGEQIGNRTVPVLCHHRLLSRL